MARPAPSSAVSRVAREPLVWFLALGALLFALRGPEGEANTADERVVVSAGRIEQLAGVFAKTRLRPPTGEELHGLIRDYVLEELKVRQAREMGLDREDTVIRRRLAQKWRFFTEQDADLLSPSDEDLQAFLERHVERFRVDATCTFRQVLTSPDRHGDELESVVHARLAALRAGEEVEGDATLLPPALAEVSTGEVARQFGEEFAAALFELPEGQWARARSTFGVHVVRIDARDPGRLPDLDEVRAAVTREWIGTQRAAREQRREEDLLEGVEVVVEWPEADANEEPDGSSEAGG